MRLGEIGWKLEVLVSASIAGRGSLLEHAFASIQPLFHFCLCRESFDQGRDLGSGIVASNLDPLIVPVPGAVDRSRDQNDALLVRMMGFIFL